MRGGRGAVRLAPRVGCWSAALAISVAVVRLSESVAGGLVTAGLLAMAVVGGAVQAWAVYVEPRLFGPARSPVEVMANRREVAERDHVASARALAAVSSADPDQCERRRNRSTRTGICERHR